MLKRIQSNWNFHASLLEIHGTAPLKDNLAVSHKIKHAITIRPSTCTIEHLYQK